MFEILNIVQNIAFKAFYTRFEFAYLNYFMAVSSILGLV